MKFNDIFLKACRKQPTERVPVWYMRQAGRYDPDYRKIKEKYSLLEICRIPELAAKVTMMPVQKLGVDAAILYSDIMNPVAAIGIELDIVKNVGPVIHNPIRTTEDIRRLRPLQPEEDLPHVLETIRILKRELDVPLIGFAGAPFTIASYMIEGKPSRNYMRTKELMYNRPGDWQELMEKLGDMIINYLKSQIQAGAHAVQVFDSWVGALAPRDFRKFVLPTISRIFAALAPMNVPLIYFPGVASGELLPELRDLQADVIGLDWRVSLAEGRRRIGERFAVQGNLDPLVLTAPLSVIQEQAEHILNQGLEKPGYIFNLGHGLFPEASLDKLKALTEFVQTYTKR